MRALRVVRELSAAAAAPSHGHEHGHCAAVAITGARRRRRVIPAPRIRRPIVQAAVRHRLHLVVVWLLLAPHHADVGRIPVG
eukprot:932017-Prymnesium_polylepis.2